MIGMRSATTALILAASLASVAFAQQQPAKPATTPQPAKPAATPQPARPAAPPANPRARQEHPGRTRGGPGGGGGGGEPPLARRVGRRGRLSRLAGRQKGLLRARKAEDDEEGAGRAKARPVLRLRPHPPRRQGEE